MRYYLSFTSKDAATDRSAFQAFKRGCQPPTLYWWPEPVEINGLWWMDVSYGSDDGGIWLTDEEQTRVVNELPEQTNEDGINP